MPTRPRARYSLLCFFLGKGNIQNWHSSCVLMLPPPPPVPLICSAPSPLSRSCLNPPPHPPPVPLLFSLPTFPDLLSILPPLPLPRSFFYPPTPLSRSSFHALSWLSFDASFIIAGGQRRALCTHTHPFPRSSFHTFSRPFHRYHSTPLPFLSFHAPCIVIFSRPSHHYLFTPLLSF